MNANFGTSAQNAESELSSARLIKEFRIGARGKITNELTADELAKRLEGLTVTVPGLRESPENVKAFAEILLYRPRHASRVFEALELLQREASECVSCPRVLGALLSSSLCYGNHDFLELERLGGKDSAFRYLVDMTLTLKRLCNGSELPADALCKIVAACDSCGDIGKLHHNTLCIPELVWAEGMLSDMDALCAFCHEVRGHQGESWRYLSTRHHKSRQKRSK